MKNRTVFAIMAVVGVAALAGLWVMVQGGSEAPTPARGAPSGSAARPSGWTSQSRGPANQPSLPQAGSAGSALPAKVNEYASNGAIVRDHRVNPTSPFEPSAMPAPPNGRRLQSTLTKAVADRVRDAMHECVKGLPPSARGERPRLEGAINIAIKAKQVVVNRADLVVRDVSGDAAEATKQCIAGKSLSITQPAGDEVDLESYDINLSFVLM